MTDPFLPREAIRRLTCRKKPAAQRRALDDMGIRYVVDREGYPLVWREMPTARTMPNWSAVR